MDNELYIQHIVQILRALTPDPLRAVYMMVKEMYRLLDDSKNRVS